MSWSIERQLAALVATAVAVLLAVGLVGYIGVVGIDREANHLAVDQAALVAQQDADMAHDALRADVLAAILASSPQEHDKAIADAVEHGEQANDDMRKNAALMPRISRRDDIRHSGEVAASGLFSYARQAEAIARTAATDRPEAVRQLPSFLAAFSRLEGQMFQLTRLIEGEAESAQTKGNAAAESARTNTAVVGLIALVLLGMLAGAVRRSVRRILAEKSRAQRDSMQIRERIEREAERDQFQNRLTDAFDMAGSEGDALGVVRSALVSMADVGATELLLADSSHAHLTTAADHPVAGSPGCPVQYPADCPAVRRGQTLVFPSSEEINACPKLRNRPSGPTGAVCVPITFMGRALGVLHSATESGSTPDPATLARLTTLGAQTGTRVGTLRAFATTQLQAETDPLTGLPNRRTFEETVRSLLTQGSVAVAMCDLDHFKSINDKHGHDTGDRALRLFSRTLRRSVRPQDVVARWGGEEFVLALPGCSEAEAESVIGRMQEDLVLELTGGQVPQFTASFGIAEAARGGSVAAALGLADLALRSAKIAGRNRVLRASSLAPYNPAGDVAYGD
ncbi:MAG: GGDEF domain-containing protein [Mycobacteriales bacterium]